MNALMDRVRSSTPNRQDSGSISQRYVHPTPERLESAVANLEAYNVRQAEATKTKRVGKTERSA